MQRLLCVTITWSLVWVCFSVESNDSLDYRTISGVNGPLVVLENVKVGFGEYFVISVGTSVLGDCESATWQWRTA